MTIVDYREWVEEVLPDAERRQIDLIAQELDHLWGCCENLEQFVADAYRAHPNLDLDIASWKKYNDD